MESGNTVRNITLTLLRLSLGGLYLYAGLSKLADPAWSAAGYLRSAKSFAAFYAWLASPGLLSAVNFVNEWGLTLLGGSLLLGLLVRLSAVAGAALMLLYYLPGLSFPYVGAHGFIVDEHIVYAAALLSLAAASAGRVWGLDGWCANLPLCARYPRLRRWFG